MSNQIEHRWKIMAYCGDCAPFPHAYKMYIYRSRLERGLLQD